MKLRKRNLHNVIRNGFFIFCWFVTAGRGVVAGCGVKSSMKQTRTSRNIFERKGKDDIKQTWFLSISNINERASSRIEDSESSNTSRTIVKI